MDERVKITRCKDCKHADNDRVLHELFCMHEKMGPGAVGEYHKEGEQRQWQYQRNSRKRLPA